MGAFKVTLPQSTKATALNSKRLHDASKQTKKPIRQRVGFLISGCRELVLAIMSLSCRSALLNYLSTLLSFETLVTSLWGLQPYNAKN